jgi:hypothetical protein
MYILAMFTMLVDHVGLIFAPDQQGWRIIGRLAMPIYAYCLVQGYRHTRSKANYLKRLAFIALVSQVPFMFAMQSVHINIVGTFLVCFIVLLSLERVKVKFALYAILAGSFIVLDALPFDYGSYALLLILAFKHLKSHSLVVAHSVINVIFLFYKGWLLQIYGIIPTMILVYWPSIYTILDKIKIKRWIWRSFYPAHLAVLAIIVVIKNNNN